MTPKIKRRWVKQEKQIVYLLYRKGFLKDFKVKDLYWAEYNWYNKRLRKSKNGKYRLPIYMPEVHYCTKDYWGEYDEHSIVRHVLDMLHWQYVDTTNWNPESGEWPKSTFKRMDRTQFIHYLKKLPTKVGDNKINRVLKKITNID